MFDVTQYAAQYEILRAGIVGAPPGNRSLESVHEPAARGIGLALLVREGLAGWLKAVEAVLSGLPDAVSPAASTADSASAARTSLPTGMAVGHQHDLTMLLASLVLSTRPRAVQSPNDRGRRACR